MALSSRSPDATPVIDFHVHVVPDPLAGSIDEFRSRARTVWRPIASSMHYAQTILRHLPQPARRAVDAIGVVAPLVGLLVESTPSDLRAGMTEAGIDFALLIAHPPITSNEFVLEACQEDRHLLPVVNVAPETPRPAIRLKKYVKDGARALKIHPAADGEGVDSKRYRSLLKTATDQGLPVIIHTGCIHTHLFYKDPEQGHAARFAPWFKEFRETRFVLAHMNFHEPGVALDLVEEHPNLYVDTSWQPAEVIGEAVRRVGAERVLFASDWPFMGGNLSVGISRVQDCLAHGTLNEEQARLVLGGNAVRLLGSVEKTLGKPECPLNSSV